MLHFFPDVIFSWDFIIMIGKYISLKEYDRTLFLPIPTSQLMVGVLLTLGRKLTEIYHEWLRLAPFLDLGCWGVGWISWILGLAQKSININTVDSERIKLLKNDESSTLHALCQRLEIIPRFLYCLSCG